MIIKNCMQPVVVLWHVGQRVQEECLLDLEDEGTVILQNDGNHNITSKETSPLL